MAFKASTPGIDMSPGPEPTRRQDCVIDHEVDAEAARGTMPNAPIQRLM